MIKTRNINIFNKTIRIKHNDSTESSIIEIKTLCGHTDKCPLLACLGKRQLKLWEALHECNMQAVLSMEWIMVYQTLKTFETLGLITSPCEIISSYQLNKMKLKLVNKTCNCNLYNNSNNKDEKRVQT